ncbi:MAG: T9SS type A sorting domain-containing protein [Bacteroidota bacterium]
MLRTAFILLAIFAGNTGAQDFRITLSHFPAGCSFQNGGLYASNSVAGQTLSGEFSSDRYKLSCGFLFVMSSTSPPLPVELISFEAVPLNDLVELRWSTATEINVLGFEIQKRAVPSTEWKTMVFIESADRTNSPLDYIYCDTEPFGGRTVVYRLIEVTIDGKKNILAEKSAALMPDKFMLYQNYPNPFNLSTKIKFSLTVKSHVLISLYDLLGRQAAVATDTDFPPGFHMVEFNASALSSGVYFINIIAGDYISVKKAVVLK